MTRAGSRPGLCGYHTHPVRPPCFASTKPSIASMAARSMGLPSSAAPFRLTDTLRPGGKRQFPPDQRGVTGWPSTTRSAGASAWSRPALSNAHQPARPAAFATVAPSERMVDVDACRERADCIAATAVATSLACMAVAANPSQASGRSIRAVRDWNNSIAAAVSPPRRQAIARLSAIVLSVGTIRRALSSQARASGGSVAASPLFQASLARPDHISADVRTGRPLFSPRLPDNREPLTLSSPTSHPLRDQPAADAASVEIACSEGRFAKSPATSPTPWARAASNQNRASEMFCSPARPRAKYRPSIICP